MDFDFKKMGMSIKRTAVCAVLNKFVNNSVIQGIIAKYVGRYAEVKQIEAREDGYHAIIRLRGQEDDLVIFLKDIRRLKDNSGIVLHGFKANQEWLTNLLEDFAEGKEIPIPEFTGRDTLFSVLLE